MRHFICILTIASLLLSCGQTDTKQKELELKERELSLKEKELALKEKGISNSDSLVQNTIQEPKSPSATPKVTTLNEEQPINNVQETFFGCWYWGDKNIGFAILEVKPKGLLIIHRLDLYEDKEVKQTAGYKMAGTKIIFTNNTLLMQSKYHIESIQNEKFLVEEYPNKPNRFKKVNCK